MAAKKVKSNQHDTYLQKTGVIYARYSSHNQKEESIEQQIAECTEFAEKNEINIVHIYADKAITGRSDKRREFQRMMRDAEKGTFGVVVAYKSNRISRNMLNALQYEAKLNILGIETLYAKEEFGNTAAGRFALRTMMNVNQFYSENMAEDIKRGLMDNAEACKVNGTVPFGYVRGDDGRYQIVEKEAAIVREVFQRSLAGTPFVEIQDDLNRRGIKTKQGKPWNKNSFRRMLKNDRYPGIYRYNGIIKDGGIPAIITKEMFAQMQEMLTTKKNPQGRQQENGAYLLTGKLRCGYCGAYMVGVSGTGRNGTLHHYYSCQTRRTEKSCHKENVRRDEIEQRVAELTKAYIMNDETIELIADSAMEFDRQARQEDGLSPLKEQLAAQRKAQKNIMDAIEAGIFTTTTRDRLLEIEGSISALEGEIAKYTVSHKPLDRERFVYALSQFKNGDVHDKKYQKQLIDAFVKTVYLWDDFIRIDYYSSNKKSSSECRLDIAPASPYDGLEGSHKLPSPPPKEKRTARRCVSLLPSLPRLKHCIGYDTICLTHILRERIYGYLGTALSEGAGTVSPGGCLALYLRASCGVRAGKRKRRHLHRLLLGGLQRRHESVRRACGRPEHVCKQRPDGGQADDRFPGRAALWRRQRYALRRLPGILHAAVREEQGHGDHGGLCVP